MPDVNLPLSGSVSQVINPWAAYVTALGSQFGLININLGTSSDPDTEKEILSEVASYGKQLGRIGDALIVLLRHLPADTHLAPDETAAIEDLKTLLREIAGVKDRHGAKSVLRP